jgi:cell division protein FtsL
VAAVKTHFNQAYRQAPWRKATQMGVIFLIAAVLVASILWIMLTVTVQAASAGLEIQSLETKHETLLREIASYRTDIATHTSATKMEARAKELGFRQAIPEEINYMIIPGYIGRMPQIAAPPPTVSAQPVLIKPSYTQSLSEWLFQGIIKYSERTRGQLP